MSFLGEIKRRKEVSDGEALAYSYRIFRYYLPFANRS